jgi:outer membrane receptor protein involved in Fe transport
MNHCCVRDSVLFGIVIFTVIGNSHILAEEVDIIQNESIEVIGITPSHGTGLPEDMIPFSIQTATAEDIDRSKSLSLSDFLNRNLGSVIINEAQNNPLQPDIQYRGFTSSPLLGLPQGIAVYQNGVRVNEAFGDTVNWDLIPESSIASINLIGGANPVFGLNTLGGAISITTKNGFTHEGHSFETYGGSYERIVSTIESGGNNGTWGYFFTGSFFDEEGWRDASESNALNLFGVVSWRGDDSTLDLSFNHGDTELIGNGPIPVELEAIDRSAIFTSPDITENDLLLVNLEGTHWFNDEIQLAGNIFYRSNDTNSFNGDGTEFEQCDDGFLHEWDEDEDDADASGDCNAGEGDIVIDQNGNFIPNTVAGADLDAINNISSREQETFGSIIQTSFLNDLFDHQNFLIIGASYNQALADFGAVVEAASLNADRSTSGTGLFAVADGTQIKTHTRTWSIYLTDTFSITDELTLTLSGRYNNTSVKIGDRSTMNPLVDPDDPGALNGEHDYGRFNPAIGLNWSFHQNIVAYGSYSESARAPTTVELSCADPDAPCNLPNAFLADPPLDQVVTKSFEGGLRGTLNSGVKWNVGAFHSINNDDIIFISTGGISSNEGFFDNIGDTKRIGFELGFSGGWGKLDWFTNYSYLEATFDDSFTSSSPNNPSADANGDIAVEEGDRIPGLPEHNLKIGGDYHLTPKLTIGSDLVYNSDQHFRGDEANLLDTIDGHIVVNARASYQFNKNISVFANVNNLLDSDYETFGLLGEPEEIFSGFSNPRFVGVGAPISGFVGMKIEFL